MLTGPTVAPIGDLSDSAGPTAGTISVALEEMPGIADGLDTVSRNCADRTMPILGIAAETRLFLGINGHAQQAAGLCTGLATDLGISAAKFGATAAAVRAAHSSYLQTENIVAGWFESMSIAKDGKLPDGRSTRDHLRGLVAGEPGEADYLIKLIIPELGYFSASRTLPYSPLVAGILFGATAYMDATWNPEIARSRAFDRLAGMFGIPRGLVRKALENGGVQTKSAAVGKSAVTKAHNIRTAGAEEYDVAAHRGEKNRFSVGASTERLQAAAKAQDQEFERSQQDPTKGERGAVLVTVMYEAGHEGDPTHALYVVSVPGTNFKSWGGSPIDPRGIAREAMGVDDMNAAYEMILQALRDAGAPQGARVYMEGFSQGAMISMNMANNTEVAKEFNIVGVYTQAAPVRSLPDKKRDFVVDNVEGEGDGVPDAIVRDKGGWRPDERDTSITVENSKHYGRRYQEALDREGYSDEVLDGMRVAMDGKEYVQGEQTVTSASTMPDGMLPIERGVFIAAEGAYYTALAGIAGVRLDGKGVAELADQIIGDPLRGMESAARASIGDARYKAEQAVIDVGVTAHKVHDGITDYVNEETATKAVDTARDVWEDAKRRLPHPEPQPAWPETPAPQMPKVPLLQGYNPQNIPPAINMPDDLSRPEPAPINMPVDLSRPEPAPIKLPARIEAEGHRPPAGLIPPDILPKPADLYTHIEKAVTQPFIEQLQLPNAGSVLKNPPIFGSGQGGDYDGGESLIPTLPGLKPAPMLPPKSIDPGFLAPTPPENIDPGFRAPGPPEDLTPIEESEPLMV